MQIKNIRWRGHKYLVDLGPELSRAARVRLEWMDFYEQRGRNASLTCRHFGISRQCLYRWLRRFDPMNLRSLEDGSHRPRHLRTPTWSAELALSVQRVREQYPRWGKDKLALLLEREGQQVSVSMVGRILKKLKQRGLLKEPPLRAVSARKVSRSRPYAVRKPRDWRVESPGDLVQIDTLDVRPSPGLVRKHFTARDVVSRWDVLEVYVRATSKSAALFLDTVQKRMPFPIRACQVDGGSEFAAFFEAECQRRGIRLFVLPPRSPKLNGSVERAQRTHTEEFYEVQDPPLSVAGLNHYLQRWETVYNTIRPHQALGYLTPLQFLASFKGTFPLPSQLQDCH